MVVRTVWSGGVRAVNGKELGANELSSLTVNMIIEEDTLEVHPFMLADLGDNDNNIDLCLDQEGIPISVRAEAGIAIDPRDDVNPATTIEVVSRW